MENSSEFVQDFIGINASAKTNNRHLTPDHEVRQPPNSQLVLHSNHHRMPQFGSSAPNFCEIIPTISSDTNAPNSKSEGLLNTPAQSTMQQRTNSYLSRAHNVNSADSSKQELSNPMGMPVVPENPYLKKHTPSRFEKPDSISRPSDQYSSLHSPMNNPYRKKPANGNISSRSDNVKFKSNVIKHDAYSPSKMNSEVELIKRDSLTPVSEKDRRASVLSDRSNIRAILGTCFKY